MQKAYFIIILAFLGIFFILKISNSNKDKSKIVIDTSTALSAITPIEETTSTAQDEPLVLGEETEKLEDTEFDLDKYTYSAILKTTKGEMTIEFNKDQTPKTVMNFLKLAQKGFYDNTIFHRVIENFMIQGGDPKGNGTGGPGYKFDDEPFSGEYERGVVAMANSGPNTNGSQFFIMHKDYPLPKDYVIFGKVIEGFEVLDLIATEKVMLSSSDEMSKPVNPVTIKSIEIIEKVKD